MRIREHTLRAERLVHHARRWDGTMTRCRGLVAFAFGCLVILFDGAQAQMGGGPVQRQRAPVFAGTDFFVAPRASTMAGPLQLRGQLELAWGAFSSWHGGGSVGIEPLDRIQLTAGLQRGAAVSDIGTGTHRVISLALHARRHGIAVAREMVALSVEPRTSELRGTELRAWTGIGRFDLGLSLRTATVAEHGEAVDEHTYVVAGYEFVSRRHSRYVHIAARRDVEAEISAQVGMLRMTGVAGHALADYATTPRTWAYGRIALPLPRGLELLAEAGRNDGSTSITREQGRFVRLGLGFDFARREGSASDRELVAPQPPVAGASAEVSVTEGSAQLLIRSPDAQSIEVKGDFTAWRPSIMQKLPDGRWTFPLPGGVLRFNIRVNGGAWTVPAGVPVVADEFSGAPVAVLVVRRES
jgi:hypothetical protein